MNAAFDLLIAIVRLISITFISVGIGGLAIYFSTRLITRPSKK